VNPKSLVTDNYITASCVIEKGSVYKDGSSLYGNTAALPEFLPGVYHHFQRAYPKFYKMDNLSKLGWLAAEILLKDNFDKENYAPEDTAVILANANSSLDDDLKYLDSIKDGASPSLFVYTLPNIVIGEICIRNHFKGEQAFYIQQEFDVDFIAQQVNYLLDKNIQQACICGWVDVLKEEYKAVLFLVEKGKKEKSVLFSAENMDSIFGGKGAI
jgi:hypothetical protein